jgi:hypothetical protein
MKGEWIKNKKCMVKGCHNKRDYKEFDLFVGDMCISCYEMITTGIVKPGTTFINDIYGDLKSILRWLEPLNNTIEKYRGKI